MKLALTITVALPLLLVTLIDPAFAREPTWQEKRMREEEARTRQLNEQRQREHNERLRRSLEEYDRMTRDSSTQTYYLGGDKGNPNPNDPSRMLDQPPPQPNRSAPPQGRVYTNPNAAKAYPPAGSDKGCVKSGSGLFGAPVECLEINSMWVGKGPCRRKLTYSKGYKDTAHGSGSLSLAEHRRCRQYIKDQQNARCKPDPKHGANMYQFAAACKYKVEDEIAERSIW